ncbi:uroporphyrinogen-III synthase [Vibrio astriarenae]|uniref:uroporphyrinogen-III synthase n=1 Tax=Vibrio astriarenae TaxID=1481923 RepID=UPI0037357D78
MSVLITRPDEPGKQLTQQLLEVGISAHHFPLISICASTAIDHLQLDINCSDIIIAVSQYAVIYADKAISSWPKHSTYLAIGSKTAQQLEQVTQSKVYTPEIHESESFLTLPQLQPSTVKGKKVTILRGNGGRELIKERLSLRGADVEYREVYQRKNLYFDSKSTVKEWKDKQIKHVVITSNEQLNHLLSMCKSDKQWLIERTLYVPSKRIATQAKALGFSKVICTHGASNPVISCALQAHIKENNQ